MIIMAEQDKEYKTAPSRRRANAKYDKESVQQFTLRVPMGQLDKIKNYCNNKHEEDPQNPKYQSLNTLIIAALEKETGLDIRGILKEIERRNDIIAAKKQWLETDPLNLKSKSSEVLTDEGYRKYLDTKLEEMWNEIKDAEVKNYQRRKLKTER